MFYICNNPIIYIGLISRNVCLTNNIQKPAQKCLTQMDATAPAMLVWVWIHTIAQMDATALAMLVWRWTQTIAQMDATALAMLVWVWTHMIPIMDATALAMLVWEWTHMIPQMDATALAMLVWVWTDMIGHLAWLMLVLATHLSHLYSYTCVWYTPLLHMLNMCITDVLHVLHWGVWIMCNNNNIIINFYYPQ